MLRNKLVRSDGSIIDSSVILSCEYTEDVNSGENLTVGDVTASEINVSIMSTDLVEQDEVLTYYIIEDDVETRIGVFNVDKPTVASRTSVKFSAYDNIAKTEKIFSDWLRENQSLFPMTLAELATYACGYCGLTLATAEFPMSDIEINAFYADGIRCRQILSWVSAAAGRFVRANSNGDIEFAWYTAATDIIIAPNSDFAVDFQYDNDGNVSVTGDAVTLSDDGEGNVDVFIPGVSVMANDGEVLIEAAGTQLPYKSGGLSYETYATAPIERVQIKQSDDDLGVIYPSDADGNCFTISGNMLLATCSTEDITSVAATLYEQLCTISYVPAKVSMYRTIAVRSGNIVRIRDTHGTEITTYVMKVSINGSGTNIESSGNKSYETNAAVASEKYTNVLGRLLEIQKTIDGLRVANSDLAGKVGTLELSTEEFKTSVSNTYITADAFGEYQTTVSTKFTETDNSFEMKFDQRIDEVSSDSQDKYKELSSYIRFEDGNIILGKSGSEFLPIIKNDRISFVKNTTNYPELAWFEDDLLHVADGEFTTQLRIGKFGFKPGANGNLSFKKVVT